MPFYMAENLFIKMALGEAYEYSSFVQKYNGKQFEEMVGEYTYTQTDTETNEQKERKKRVIIYKLQ